MNTRLIAVALMLGLVVPAPSGASDIQSRIQAQQAKAHAVHAKLHDKRRELHKATIKLNDLQAQLDHTNAAIASVNARLGELSAQERSTQHKLRWNTIQLNAAERSLKLHDDLLKRRLVDVYENGQFGYLPVLLSATTFSDFVERWEDVRLLISSNERAIRERKAAELKVAGVERSLETVAITLQAEHLAQQRSQNQLDTLAIERRNLVGLAARRRSHVAIQVASLEELSASQEATLEALIRQRQAEIAAAQHAQRSAAGIAGSGPTGGGGAPGTLSWPVTGTITSPFGWRQNPFGGGPDFHPGLDIAAPTGTTITAAASGTVIMAQWYGGYGNYILIDNGGGISTGYGHMSAIYVAKGQVVKRGQAIGAVGSTGASTGPHLHFEVRRDGKPIDPTPWLH